MILACGKQVRQGRGRPSLLTSGACPAVRATRRARVHTKHERAALAARPAAPRSPRGGRPAPFVTPCGNRRPRAAARPAGLSDEDVAAVCGFVAGEPGGLPRTLRALRLGPPCAPGGAPGVLSDGAWRALAGALAACARLEAAEVRARAPAGQLTADHTDGLCLHQRGLSLLQAVLSLPPTRLDFRHSLFALLCRHPPQGQAAGARRAPAAPCPPWPAARHRRGLRCTQP